jgi:acetyl esterase/lipase
MVVGLATILFGLALGAAETPPQIPLWPQGAPGFEDRRQEPERAQDYWVRNIHQPSMTAFRPPKEKSTATAVVICPGGGHRELVFKAEGEEPARFLNNIGVTAFVLKYRLGREEGSPYTIQKHALEDGQRAMRWVRAHAAEYGLATNRIGMVGFSAGGEVVSMVAYAQGGGNVSAPDPIDRENCMPDFQVLIYPGPLGIPEVLPTNAPPAFLLVANDDRAAGTITRLLQKYREARLPVEAHVFARGGHGFNMGNRSKLISVKSWPQRLADWMNDSGLLGDTPRN